jgi:hypothetical protein
MTTQIDFNFSDSQRDAILKYLQSGNRITPLEALEKFKCMRLGGRIYDLKRAGFQIEKRMVTVPSGKKVAEYRLVDENQTSYSPATELERQSVGG